MKEGEAIGIPTIFEGCLGEAHHVGSSLAMVLGRKLSLCIAIARLQVRGNSTLDCLRRHCACQFLLSLLQKCCGKMLLEKQSDCGEK